MGTCGAHAMSDVDVLSMVDEWQKKQMLRGEYPPSDTGIYSLIESDDSLFLDVNTRIPAPNSFPASTIIPTLLVLVNGASHVWICKETSAHHIINNDDEWIIRYPIHILADRLL